MSGDGDQPRVLHKDSPIKGGTPDHALVTKVPTMVEGDKVVLESTEFCQLTVKEIKRDLEKTIRVVGMADMAVRGMGDSTVAMKGGKEAVISISAAARKDRLTNSGAHMIWHLRARQASIERVISTNDAKDIHTICQETRIVRVTF